MIECHMPELQYLSDRLKGTLHHNSNGYYIVTDEFSDIEVCKKEIDDFSVHYDIRDTHQEVSEELAGGFYDNDIPMLYYVFTIELKEKVFDKNIQ